jgi:hypothetical protein
LSNSFSSFSSNDVLTDGLSVSWNIPQTVEGKMFGVTCTPITLKISEQVFSVYIQKKYGVCIILHCIPFHNLLNFFPFSQDASLQPTSTQQLHVFKWSIVYPIITKILILCRIQINLSRLMLRVVKRIIITPQSWPAHF